MNSDKLLKLAALLDTVDEDAFDYQVFVSADWRLGDAHLACGAPACALGHATRIEGLGLYLEPGTTMPGRIRCEGLDLPPYPYDELPGGDDSNSNTVIDFRVSMHAAMHAFDLTYNEACYLFMPGTPPPAEFGELDDAPADEANAQAVAAHIRDFVACKLKWPSDPSD